MCFLEHILSYGFLRTIFHIISRVSGIGNVRFGLRIISTVNPPPHCREGFIPEIGGIYLTTTLGTKEVVKGDDYFSLL